jgi:sterol desaturase/sphingolipid hydroxylase (fatty acid hydroxylase superfamily)
VVFDLLDYWLHRAQHQFNWWWALHACTTASAR